MGRERSSTSTNAAHQDEIKKVLKDCIAVLVDLVIQIGKIEKFFTTLTGVIDEVVLPQAQQFDRDMKKVGKYAAADKYINVDDKTKQTIYVSTLQLKAYFSLLEDIAGMYTQVDKDYIRHGLDLCDQLSAGSASKIPMATLSQQLSNYSSESARAVAEMISSVSWPPSVGQVFTDLGNHSVRQKSSKGSRNAPNRPLTI